jgi:acetoin utilization protein AcuC
LERLARFLHSEKLDTGGYPDGCPFDSGRAGRTLDVVRSLGFLNYANTALVEPEPLSRDTLEWFHSSRYLDVLRLAGKGEHDYTALKMGLGTPDCPLFKDMYEFSLLAAGATVHGAKLILENEAEIAFNPSGGFHHAGPGNASGFCYINDVVLAAMLFAKAGKRVLTIDLDAHHGDGVQNAFYDNPNVTTISMHESGKTLFPGTGFETELGSGDGVGNCINIPLPVGTYDPIYYRAFAETVLPVVNHLKPDTIILELGMDGLASDPLAHLNLSNNVYADIVADLVELHIPLLVTGGGGYNPDAAVRGWALSWSVLADGRLEEHNVEAGLGGVMLENTAWFGGLRDRTLLSHGGYRKAVEEEVMATVKKIHKTAFPLLGV